MTSFTEFGAVRGLRNLEDPAPKLSRTGGEDDGDYTLESRTPPGHTQDLDSEELTPLSQSSSKIKEQNAQVFANIREYPGGDLRFTLVDDVAGALQDRGAQVDRLQSTLPKVPVERPEIEPPEDLIEEEEEGIAKIYERPANAARATDIYKQHESAVKAADSAGLLPKPEAPPIEAVTSGPEDSGREPQPAQINKASQSEKGAPVVGSSVDVVA